MFIMLNVSGSCDPLVDHVIYSCMLSRRDISANWIFQSNVLVERQKFYKKCTFLVQITVRSFIINKCCSFSHHWVKL